MSRRTRPRTPSRKTAKPARELVPLSPDQELVLRRAYLTCVEADRQRAAAYQHLGDLCGVIAGEGYTLIPSDDVQKIELYRRA